MAVDEKFMRQALAKAREGIARGQSPFGACIVRGDEVIACTHNRVWDTTDITAHAEVVCIREACLKLNTVDLSGCVIYSTCEPCPMCFASCHWAKLDKIIFGTRIADARKIGFSELDISNTEMKQRGGSPVVIVEDFLREESRALFDEWLSRQDRRIY